MSILSEVTSNQFQLFIKRWYVDHGRFELPWRKTTDPYHILVSELMLQQTQVERVIPKFNAFIHRFPTISALASAPQSEVVSLWQGLGYNRRVLNLHATAKILQKTDTFPSESDDLLALPGIGPYTTSAIQVFAFNMPTVVIETNIRAVYLYHFFPNQTNIPDEKLIPLIAESMDSSNPREWYAALMDYGSYLKKVVINPTRASKSYSKQSNFTYSRRRVRGEILKLLTISDSLSTENIRKEIKGNLAHFNSALEQLEKEGFIQKSVRGWQLHQ